MTSDTGEHQERVTVTLTFRIDPQHLLHTTDFKGRNEGITVGSVGAYLLHHHDAGDGYVHFTVTHNGGDPK